MARRSKTLADRPPQPAVAHAPLDDAVGALLTCGLPAALELLQRWVTPATDSSVPPLTQRLLFLASAVLHQHPRRALDVCEHILSGASPPTEALLMAGMLQDLLGERKASEASMRAVVDAAAATPSQKLRAANLLVRFGQQALALRTARAAFDAMGRPLEQAATLLYIAQVTADWSLVDQLTAQLRAAYAQGDVAKANESPRTHLLWCDDELTNIEVLRHWSARQLPQARTQRPPVQALQGRRIRVGYLSSDFREHPTARLVNGLLRHHDRSAFELFMYCSGWDDGSSLRKEVESHFDHIHSVAGLADEQAAELIRSHGVDVLVELNGPTRGHRMGILGFRPAPVQIDYLGWPGSVGGRVVDYVVGDDSTVPPGAEAAYPEQVIRLRKVYQVNDHAARTLLPRPTRAEAGLPQGDYLILGMFNAINKVHNAVWDVWMKILQAVPRAVLWILDPGPQARQLIAQAAQARGVAAERLVVAPRLKEAQHLARLQLCDLMLDPWPYGGHTSTADALFAGVPVVALDGQNFASRVSGALLRAAGMSAMVQKDREGYARLAVGLLRNPAELARVKAFVREQVPSSDVFNARGKTRQLEQAYRAALERVALGTSISTAKHVEVVPASDGDATGADQKGASNLVLDPAEVSAKRHGAPYLISLYLPQFHPIPENDAWWGKGFTEWRNVAKAKPLYSAHYQPHLPADLGFYDLRLPEVREAQAQLAQQSGVDAFCYYHYWFAGRRVLERPFQEVLETGAPVFPFLLCWANQSWTGVWHGSPDRVLIQQTYPGKQDYIDHFKSLLPAFRDPRYVKVKGRPMFVVWAPESLPDPRGFVLLWRRLAVEAGLPGMHFVGAQHNNAKWQPEALGFDATLPLFMPPRQLRIRNGVPYPTVYRYEDIYEKFLPSKPADGKTYPCVKPNWDNTPRSGVNGLIFEGATPELFRKQLTKALQWSRGMPQDDRVVFIKAWNEWADGNFLEPGQRYGHAYLNVIREELDRFQDAAFPAERSDPI